MFGFGKPTGIDLLGERFGLIPKPKARKGRSAATFHAGDTVNMSIGQGQVLVTPMQVARFMSAVANGGVLWKPRLVQRIERPERGVVWSDTGTVNGHVDLSPAVWAFLRQSLWAVVNDGGTGAAARIAGMDIAGKTGTAQMIANSKADKGQDHAWFASFAPANAAEVVVVVMVERGGKGGQVAAPIARKIFNSIFLEKVASVDLGG
jgi:penicillin-binding protein 2